MSSIRQLQASCGSVKRLYLPCFFSDGSNEEMISEDAYYFLQAFFKSEEGAKYKDSPLHIVGESYGGHYAPAIAHRIWRGNNDLKEGLATLNLQGLAVGNGLTDPETQYKY